MNTLRVIASRKVLVPVVAATAALAVVFFAYLAAVVSPEENLEGLPVALVNDDRGAKLGGERVSLGDRVVENASGPDSPASEVVGWQRPGSREAALEGIGRGELYGAIVIPSDYSERIAAIASPPEIPIAVVNEDEGATLGGRPANLGEEVTARITSPDSPAPSSIEWTKLGERRAALEGLENGRLYAAIVVPAGYSEQVAGMAGPPPGAPTGVPPAAAPPSAGQAPEPAELELLTSPAVRPSTTAQIEGAFAGIVGGVSGATSERILNGISQQGMPVPPGAAPVISDPVRGSVSEAGVSEQAGPLPKTPRPAQIQILTNPSAGQAASGPVENISAGLVSAVSRATSERLSETAGERGAALPPEVAAVLGDPVRAEVAEAQPVGEDSGNGQSPFFLAFLANLAALMGGAAIFFGARAAADDLSARGRRVSQAGIWTARLLLGLLYAVLVAAVEAWVAFGLLGVEHEAGVAQVWIFLALAVAATACLTMLLASLFGTAGIGISAVLNVLLGLVSSGGTSPLQALPGFYQAYADWLPVRYSMDGLRSLLFYGGDLASLSPGTGGARDAFSSIADAATGFSGLQSAVWFLGACLVATALLGYAVSVLKDLFGDRRKGAKKEQETREPAAPAVG